MGNRTLAVKVPAEGVSFAEREFAARYLAATRDRLVEATKGLSEAQWKFKPAANRWSIAEVMEHVAVVEDRVQEIIGSMPQAPEDGGDRDLKQVDAFVLVVIPMRHPRYKAPERVSPLGERTGLQALEHFLESRQKTSALLPVSQILRGRVVPHPVFGPWDGYQWILAGASHCARHTGQILEVKADPNFPVT